MSATEGEEFNPYRVLNLHEDASQKEVKSRFFSLSKAFHPDKQPAELFKESSQQFEKVEEAYKILSAPMRKYVFDKYGIEGIKVCNEKYGKLENLEEEFKETSIKNEHMQESEELDDADKLESQAQLKLMKEKVKENIEYLHRRLEEEHLCQTFTKEVSVSQVVDLEEVIDHYIKKIPHSHQARAAGMRPNVNFGGLFLHHWFMLPEYKGVQHLFGVYANNNPAKNGTGYGFKYRFRKVLPKLKNAELVGLFSVGDAEKDASLNLEKAFDNGLHLTLNTKLGEGSVSALINRRFREDLNWYSQGQYDGGGDLLTGISKEFKNLGMKLDCGIQTSSDKLRITETLSKQVTKKMVAFATLNTFFTPAPVSQLTMGFSYKLSSTAKFSFSSSFVGKSFSWEVRYTRLGFKLRLPISLGNKCNSDVLLLSLGVTGAVFYATYLYDKFRKRTASHLRKLERKHRSRLMDGRRTLNATIGEIHTDVGHKVVAESARKGIVILKAYYGYGPFVTALYAQELRKWSYTRSFKPNKPLNHLLMESIQESENIFNDEPSEIIDIRILIQQMVANSQLDFTLESLHNARGIYNPCLDDACEPYLMLVVYMNEKIFIRLLKKTKQRVSLNADYDKYINEAPTESKYSFKAWASSIMA